jgi:hypothetical protein
LCGDGNVPLTPRINGFDSSGAYNDYSDMVMFIQLLIIGNSNLEVGFGKKTPNLFSNMHDKGAVCAVGVFRLEYFSSFHDDSC